jgi:hypothetical protein
MSHSAPSNRPPLLRIAAKPAAVFGLAVILFGLSLHIAIDHF